MEKNTVWCEWRIFWQSINIRRYDNYLFHEEDTKHTTQPMVHTFHYDVDVLDPQAKAVEAYSSSTTM